MDKQVPYGQSSTTALDEGWLSGIVPAMGDRLSRRGLLGGVAKASAVMAGATTGLFKIGGILGTDVQEAMGCFFCWYSEGACVASVLISRCTNADGIRSCPCWEYSSDGCKAICLAGHHPIACYWYCTSCDPCSSGC